MNRPVMLIFAIASTAVLQASAQEVRVDFDHGCSFSRYKTYNWKSSPEPHRPSSLFPNQLMQQRIVRFVEEALSGKGLERTESAPDILVAYKMMVTEEPQYTTYSDSIGPAWGWGGWGDWGCCGWAGWGNSISTTTTQVIRVGTLAIDMTDPHQNQLVFEGLSTATISSKAEKNVKRLQKGVSEIFEKYPPRR